MMQKILKGIALFFVAVLLSVHISSGEHEELRIVKTHSADQYMMVIPGSIMLSFTERINYCGPGVNFLRFILNDLSDIQFYSGYLKFLAGDFYFAFSSGLTPALDDPDIVFPFHTFW